MLSRRDLLAAGAALSLSGCYRGLPVVSAATPARAIDIHAHVFNGRDIPVVGFLTQVQFRTNKSEAPSPSKLAGLIRLGQTILLAFTRDAATELAALQREGLMDRLRPPGSLVKQDEERVAAGIAAFERETQQNAALRDDEETTSAQLVLDDLYALIGADRAQPLTDDAGGSRAAAIAAAVFSVEEPATVPDFARSTDTDGGYDLRQTLRWFGLLTRDRRDIASELFRLYPSIEVFSPSMVDFELWLIEKEAANVPVSTPQDQVRLMGEIARRETGAVLLNFAPYCPLRAALATQDGVDPLETVKLAANLGFAGVKMYPPMGFRPLGNAPNVWFGAKPGRKVRGAQIDAELHRLYAWCVANDMPIKSHGNDSLGAQSCSGVNAAPEFWRPVLTRYPDLRVNIAHFGGFEPGPSDCAAHSEPWEVQAAKLVADHENAYVDLGYWSEATGMNGGPDAGIIARVAALVDAYPRLKKRIMYGSDWSMIAREPRHNAYLSDVQTALSSIPVDPADVMSANAVEYLGLGGSTPAQARMLRHFGETHKFAQVFPG